MQGWWHRILIVTAAFLGLAYLAAPSGESTDASRRNGKIAFFDRGRVAIVSPDGSGLRIINTPRRRAVYGLEWSPDGRRLLYVTASLDLFDSYIPFTSNIWVMRANGKRRSVLPRAFDRKTNPVVESASWAPDGRRIAFTATSWKVRGNRNRVGIYIVNADGSGIRRLWSILDPGHLLGPMINSIAWSPDGRRLAFSLRVDRPEIHVMNVRGGRSRLVYKMEDYADDGLLPGIDWSPDSRSLVFTGIVHIDHPRAGVKRLPGVMVVEASGGKPRMIAAPAYSETTDPQGNSRTYSQTHAFAPTFSPDGRQIAFFFYKDLCYFPPNPPPCEYHSALVRVRRDGSGRREFLQHRLSSGSFLYADLSQPSWGSVPR
jgi:Tol biopolymer transport system component